MSGSGAVDEEEVVLTPLKAPEGKVIKIERTAKSKLDPGQVRHFASGPYQGIAVHRATNKKPLKKAPDARRVFYAHVQDLSAPTGDTHTLKERRELRFWFRSSPFLNADIEATGFFQDLLDPHNFPRDYITFLKRTLQLVKNNDNIKRLELHITIVDTDDQELDADDVTKHVTTLTKVIGGGAVGGGGRGQEDFRSQEGGAVPGQHGSYLSAEYQASGAGRGRDLDPASRQVPVQDDLFNRQHLQDSDSYQGQFHQGESASGGLDSTIMQRAVGYTGDQDPYYAQQLLQQTYPSTPGASSEDRVDHAAGSTSSATQIITSSASTEQVRSAVRVKKTKKSVKTVEVGGSGISEASARAALAAAGVTGALGKSQEDLTLGASQNGSYSVQQSVTYATGSLPPPPPAAPVVRQQPVITRRGWQVVWVARKQKLLTTLEDAYPNILSTADLLRTTKLKPSEAGYVLDDLTQRGLIQEIERGWWMRVQAKKRVVRPRASTRKSQAAALEAQAQKHEFKVVAHIPRLPPNKQPSIAIITLFFCEKLAVDAMMDPKTTYVRYKTEGEGQVYTVGMIGRHRVVSTKLSRVGHGSQARVAAGNVVTRLLGTFGALEHVLLVGVGGGVVDPEDDLRHVRLGDVVVSKPPTPGGPLYTAVTGAQRDSGGGHSFTTQSWAPESDELTKLVAAFESSSLRDFDLYATVQGYIREGLAELEGGETRFTRPPPDQDRVYLLEAGEEVEVLHPRVVRGSPRDLHPGAPVIHYGGVGAGAALNKDYKVREDFAAGSDVRVVDPGFEAVMESIEGNRKESFGLIRGVSDYTDGARRREWQPYASLAAAAVMKALILALPSKESDDDY